MNQEFIDTQVKLYRGKLTELRNAAACGDTKQEALITKLLTAAYQQQLAHLQNAQKKVAVMSDITVLPAHMFPTQNARQENKSR